MQRKCQGISVFLCAFLLACFVVNAQVVYVDQANTSGSEDGLSWATAYTTIQAGVDAAGIGGEVWVAAGIYDELREGIAGNPGTLYLPENLALYGGFIGDEVNLNQRDWENNPTIIDGKTSNEGERASHVVIGDNGTIINGFTVTGGGNSNYKYNDSTLFGGAGLYGFVNGKVANCIIAENICPTNGGGLLTRGSSASTSTIELSNVQFIDNSCKNSGGGAGAYFALVDAKITDCIFQNNSVEYGKGGGLYVYDGAITLLNSVFGNNKSGSYNGGASYLYRLSTMHINEISGCTFSNNSARNSGGALYISSGSNLSITDTTFTENSISSYAPYDGGGAICATSYGPTIENCVFDTNSAAGSGGAIKLNDISDGTSITNSIFDGNSAFGGGALHADNVNNLQLSKCEWHENRADAGGALYLYEGADFNITECIFQNNAAYKTGGAIQVRNDAVGKEISNILENCIVSNNTAPQGAGLVVEGISNLIAGNCTLTANYATAGTAIRNLNATVALYNSILWGNYSDTYNNFEYSWDSASAVGTIAYTSIVEQEIQGEDNISSDPLLVLSPSSVWAPLPNSPAIDAGNPLHAPETDFFGIQRPQGVGVDIGAYEQLQGWSDADNDGIPDHIEGDTDLDEDNIPNYLDPDSDGDGLLDSEESGSDFDLDGSSSIYDTDSDNNGVNDGSEGTLDQDNDGIPDYTDLDNDDDGLPDTYELVNGLDYNVADSHLDLDEDGLSNELEFMLGTSPQDPSEPPSDYYVAKNGSDISGDGTETNPWFSLSEALYRVANHLYTAGQIYNTPFATPNHPITIHANAGVYEEPIVLEENVYIQGAGMNDTTIQNYWDDGVVIAAENSGLRDLTVTLPSLVTGTTILVRAENVSVELDHVLLDGRLGRYTTGIVVNGVNSSNTTIHDCVFQRLNDGVYAIDTAANVSSNTFQDILGYAVFIAPPDEKQAIPATPLLGLADTIEQVGLNRFRNVAGYFVQNFTQAEVSAQLNDWGTDDPDEIARKLSSNVQFEPYISSNLQESSVVVQLINASTGKPLGLDISANVGTANKEAGAYRDTASGLFILPNIGEGTWNLIATATGFEDGTAEISLTGLDIEAIEIELTPKQGGEIVVGCAAGTSTASGSMLGDILCISFGLVILFLRKKWAKPVSTGIIG